MGKRNHGNQSQTRLFKYFGFVFSFCGVCLQAAHRAQKQSTKLFRCMYFKDTTTETEERCIADGVIYSIRTNGVLVFVPRSVDESLD